MADKRKDSLCCGGGGGRIWMETAKGERFSDLRIKQATDIGVTEIVTACPTASPCLKTASWRWKTATLLL